MASLETLPSDQRAVLQMVLGSGRGYDDIAKLLSIDRAVVRDRALAALDALGPETGVLDARRHLLTDYLLGQLPPRIAEETRESLARSPTERAWARVVASELAPLSSGPLPEIPSGAEAEAPAETQPAAAAGTERAAGAEDKGTTVPEVPEPAPAAAAGAAAAEARPAAAEQREAAGPAARQAQPAVAPAAAESSARPPRRVSRLGGGILLGVGAAVVIAVVLILVLTGGSSKKGNAAATQTSGTSTASTARATTATPVAQINLLSPSGSKTTAGIAEVLRQGNNTAIAIVGQGLPANTKHNAYAVWLYNSGNDALRLGFVNPGVGRNGRLETTGPLPTNASRFKQVLVTIETNAQAKAPGQIILQGNLTGV
jgi:hypothetical protein